MSGGVPARIALAQFLGVVAATACWPWLVGLAGAVSLGAPLRPEWHNWLILLLYGLAPAVLSIASLIFAAKEPSAPHRVGYALAPVALLGLAVMATAAGLWPIS